MATIVKAQPGAQKVVVAQKTRRDEYFHPNLLGRIFDFSSAQTVALASGTSKKWRAASDNPAIWLKKLEKLCKRLIPERLGLPDERYARVLKHFIGNDVVFSEKHLQSKLRQIFETFLNGTACYRIKIVDPQNLRILQCQLRADIQNGPLERKPIFPFPLILLDGTVDFQRDEVFTYKFNHKGFKTTTRFCCFSETTETAIRGELSYSKEKIMKIFTEVLNDKLRKKFDRAELSSLQVWENLRGAFAMEWLNGFDG